MAASGYKSCCLPLGALSKRNANRLVFLGLAKTKITNYESSWSEWMKAC